jgi:hypothetical protein
MTIHLIEFKAFGDGAGLSWGVFPVTMNDGEILQAFCDDPDGYYSGVGQTFARRACLRRTATRVLVTQFHGLDI